jgi:hypothetical protein
MAMTRNIPTQVVVRDLMIALTRGWRRLHTTHRFRYHWNSVPRSHRTSKFHMLHTRWRCAPTPTKHRQLSCHSNQPQLNISAQEPPSAFFSAVSQQTEVHTRTFLQPLHQYYWIQFQGQSSSNVFAIIPWSCKSAFPVVCAPRISQVLTHVSIIHLIIILELALYRL